MTLNGTEKSALLLMSIGADQASEVLKYLTTFEIQELVSSMININQCSNITLNKILTECYNLFIKNNNLVYNNNDKYISDMLIKALGNQGSYLFNNALEMRNIRMSIQSLNSISACELANLLKGEHLQIIATILVYLNKNQSAQVLSFFNEELRTKIIIKISQFSGLDEEKIIELKNIINNLVKRKHSFCLNTGGIKTVIKILNSMKIEKEQDLLKKIKISNKELSKEIIKKMFSFENVLNVNDNVIKCLINYLEEEKLCIALQNTSQIIRKKFFSNMDQLQSKRLSSYLNEKNYVSNIAIKNEQKLILMMIKNIVDYGIFSIENLGKYYV